MKTLSDPKLPGLAVALDTDAVAALLRRSLPECRNGLELERLRVSDVTCRPGKPCWVLYTASVRPAGGHSARELLSARLLDAGEEPGPAPEELQSRLGSRPGGLFRTASAYIDEVPMVVHPYPLDTSLPQLFDAVDPEKMAEHFGGLWAARGVKVRQVTVNRLGYTPRSRAGFLYEVVGESRATGLPELRRLVGKLNANMPAARRFAAAWTLWRAASRRLNLAPPAGYVPAIGLGLQDHLRGTRLGALVSSPEIIKWAGLTARAIATLHQVSIPIEKTRTPAHEAQVVHRWAATLAMVRPDLERRVERLRDRLAGAIEAKALPAGPVHGDFHHTNVLVQEEDVAIIDLDEMAYGDPLLDVGRFLASLRVPSLREFGDLDALAEAREAFLAGYLRRVGGNWRRVRLFESASLLTAAASTFRIQRPTWKEDLPLLLDESERVLEEAAVTAIPMRSAAEVRGTASVEDPERWIDDGVYMQARLDPHVREVYGAELRSCEVSSDVSGGESRRGHRRRYRLRGWRHGEKWSVTLRGFPDRRHGGSSLIRRLRALRQATETNEETPLLPCAIAHFRSLSLLVLEVPGGDPFSSFLGTEEAPAAAARVGKALAALQRIPLDLERERSLDEELRSLRRRVEKLARSSPDLREEALAVLERFEEESRANPVRSAVVLRSVHPKHVLLGERVTLSRVDDAILSHPLLDAADFLARLALLGVEEGQTGSVECAAASFRRAYAGAGGDGGYGEKQIRVFEAGAFLRFACNRAESREEPSAVSPRTLLERGAACLED